MARLFATRQAPAARRQYLLANLDDADRGGAAQRRGELADRGPEGPRGLVRHQAFDHVSAMVQAVTREQLLGEVVARARASGGEEEILPERTFGDVDRDVHVFLGRAPVAIEPQGR